MQYIYTICNEQIGLLKIALLRNGKKTFHLLVLCIKIKFTIEYSLISLMKKTCRIVSK